MNEMTNDCLKAMKETITQKLENPSFDLTVRKDNEILFSNKQIMLEQYKLLIDSAHKIEERRSSSNSIFLGVNTLLASFLVRPSQVTDLVAKDIPLLAVLVAIGVFIAWDWLRVTTSYKMLNALNHSLIQACEKLLPLFIFSLRAEIEAEQDETKSLNRGNIILMKEKLLPKAFLCFYVVYFLTVFSYFF